MNHLQPDDGSGVSMAPGWSAAPCGRTVRARARPGNGRDRAAVLGCGAGGALLAFREMLVFDTAILDSARVRARQPLEPRSPRLASPKCRSAETLVGNVCRRYDRDRTGNTAARQATDIVDVFLSCRAQLLILECPVRLEGAAEWKEPLPPHLERSRCSVENVTLSAMSVGVPTG